MGGYSIRELTEKDIKAIVGETIKSTKAFNDDQKYVEDDTTYFERFHKNEIKIIKDAKLFVDLDESERGQLDSLLGAKQIQDIINFDSDFIVLKKALADKVVSIDPFGMNYPVVYINHSNFTTERDTNNVMSLEPKESGGLIGQGFTVTYPSGADDIHASSIKDGLKNVQKELLYMAPEYREAKKVELKKSTKLKM